MSQRDIFSGYGSSLHQHFRFDVAPAYTLLVRLSEPETGEAWLLQPFLRSDNDPSLLIPLADVWGKGVLYALAAQRLAAAAKLCSHLRTAPGPFPLSADEAGAFIIRDAPLLQAQGFVVQIPKGLGQVRQLRVVATLPQSRGGETAGFLSFDYSVAVGDLTLTPEEFSAVAAAKGRLVRVRGRWVELNPDDAARLLRVLERRGPGLKDAAALGIAAAAAGFDVTAAAGASSYSSVAELLAARVLPAKTSDRFVGELRDYQSKGVAWLCYLRDAGYGALLADDMGLGKTVQVIAYLLHSRKQADDAPSLIICPTSLLGNWAAELARFAPGLRTLVHHGAERDGAAAFAARAGCADVILTSYALAWRDHGALCKGAWHSVILDEAQNIKNPFTKQSTHVKRIRASHRVALTGTPIENRLADLWSIVDFLNPGHFPCWQEFNDSFARPIEERGDSRRAGLLKAAVGPLMLRRMKTDRGIARELPKKTEQVEWCALTEEQATLYQAVVDETLRAVKDDDRMVILAAITKLKQICNHPSNYLKDTRALAERSGKVERLRDLAASIIENGESCVVFTQFAEMASLLADDLRQRVGAPVGLIHGGIPRAERDRVVAEFQRGGGARILVCSLKVGGTGLNLTAANHAIHFDHWWNPAVETQASDRVHRIGQDRHVFIHAFVTRGTLEERIMDLLRSKRALAEAIIGKGALDRTALREFFSLRKEKAAGKRAK